MEKLDRKDIFELLCNSFDINDFFVVNGLNPCFVNYKGIGYYVYVKNLTPARLSNNNPDVWRCQLPIRQTFEDIKTSPYLFLLLGYDAENDVFATWNPFWAKQRLNVGSSVSMYSRLSLQEQSHKEYKFIRYSLNRQGEVIIFPRKMLSTYIDNINVYFPEITTYKAIGSSLRKNSNNNISMERANTLFSEYISQASFNAYCNYMLNKEDSISLKTRKSYIHYIKYVFDHDFFNKYKDAYLKYDSIDDYDKANADFLATDEIARIDRPGPGGWHGAIKAALRFYLKIYRSLHKFNGEVLSGFAAEKVITTDDIKINILEDIQHRIIKQPDLIDEIKPLMCQDTPDEIGALQALSNHFGTQYNETLEFQDWLKLLRKIDWYRLDLNVGNLSSNSVIIKSEDKEKSELKSLNIDKNKRKRRANKHVKITTPDGDTIQESSATETYLYIFEHNYPDLIVEIDFGDYVIAKEKMPDFPNTVRHQTQLSNGYYVSTNFDTETKAKILRKISDELGLGLVIEVIADNIKTEDYSSDEMCIKDEVKKVDIRLQISKMRRNGISGFFAPHKPVLLLAITSLITAGKIKDRYIILSKILRDKFNEIWDIYVPDSFRFTKNVNLPFEHLNSEPFWHQQDKLHAVISKELFDAFNNEFMRINIEDDLKLMIKCGLKLV